MGSNHMRFLAAVSSVDLNSKKNHTDPYTFEMGMTSEVMQSVLYYKIVLALLCSIFTHLILKSDNIKQQAYIDIIKGNYKSCPNCLIIIH